MLGTAHHLALTGKVDILDGWVRVQSIAITDFPPLGTNVVWADELGNIGYAFSVRVGRWKLNGREACVCGRVFQLSFPNVYLLAPMARWTGGTVLAQVKMRPPYLAAVGVLLQVSPHSGTSARTRTDENASVKICCSAGGATIRKVHATVVNASIASTGLPNTTPGLAMSKTG